MDSGFENIMDFTMNIAKLDLANLEGEIMDKIAEFQIFLPSENENIPKSQTTWCLALRT